MDFATDFKTYLIKEDSLLDSIIASQKKVRVLVTKRDWSALETEMNILEKKAEEFMILDEEKNQLINIATKKIGVAEVNKITKADTLVKEVKRKLIFSKIENDSLNTYIAITKNFLQGIFDTVVPSRRNTLYSRKGNLVKTVPDSMVLNILG